jgi:hypothetical protein
MDRLRDSIPGRARPSQPNPISRSRDKNPNLEFKTSVLVKSTFGYLWVLFIINRMERKLTFEQLWDLSQSVLTSCNGLYYHLCCDIWTTRSSKVKRNSHSKKASWRKIISTLDRTIEDKKLALLAKMIEEGWKIPVTLNEPCQVQPKPNLHQQHGFRPHKPSIQPQDLQASLAPPDFIMTSLDHPNNQGTGIFLYY